MFLIIGLGNPGRQYIKTRHNVGFMASDVISSRYNMPFSEKAKFKAEIAEGQIAGTKVILCKPQTYMNLSGQAVQPLASFHKIPPENIIVLHDEIDLEFARIKYKFDGGNAGHNGLKSLDQYLSTKAYHRIRIGVGRPENPHISVADYVLQNFASSELSEIEFKLHAIAIDIQLIITNRLEEFKGIYK